MLFRSNNIHEAGLIFSQYFIPTSKYNVLSYISMKYIITLIEQFHADMEIEDLQDPKMNEALQKFKNQKLKDYFND